MFCTMIIPNAGKDPEKAFCDIMETYMGEYPINKYEDELTALGEWARYIFNTRPVVGVRTAFIENEDGNITDYYIQVAPDRIIHRTVEV